MSGGAGSACHYEVGCDDAGDDDDYEEEKDGAEDDDVRMMLMPVGGVKAGLLPRSFCAATRLKTMIMMTMM